MSVNRVIPQSHYYSGQGRLIIGERDPLTGKSISLRQIGNCTALEVTVQTTKTDHKESQSGERAIDLTLVTEKSATFNVTCESISLENLVMGLWGSITTGLAATVVDESHEIAKGGFIALDAQNVSAVVVETDETTPVTLVLNTDYTLDPDFGTIQFTQSVTVPTGGKVNVSYTGAAGNKTLQGLTEVMPPERFVRFEGINTVDGDLVLVEIPRASFEPLQNLPLINEELASFQMTGTILRDNTITDATLSKYFRQTYLTPAA
jgi:hypothetical protein